MNSWVKNQPIVIFWHTSCRATKQLFIEEDATTFLSNATLIRRIGSAFHKVQWQTFSGELDRIKNAYIKM